MKPEREKKIKTYVCASMEVPMETIKVLHNTLRYFEHASQKKKKFFSNFPQTAFFVCFYPISNEMLYILCIKKRLKQNYGGCTTFIFTTIYIIYVFKFTFFFFRLVKIPSFVIIILFYIILLLYLFPIIEIQLKSFLYGVSLKQPWVVKPIHF